MRIFNADGRRRNQTGTAGNAGSIPMSDKLGVDDGLLEGSGGRGVTPNRPDVDSFDPEAQPGRGRPRNNPPPSVTID